MSKPLCYICKERPAGNNMAGPYSAYCAECQPVPEFQLKGNSECQCSSCLRVFTCLTAFDRHRRNLTCLSPETIGLVQVMRRDLQMWSWPPKPDEFVRKFES